MPPFNWRDYLGLAAQLEGQAAEAQKRSAISRGYYAAFKVAQNRLKVDGIAEAKKGGPHQKVWSAYKAHSDPRRKQIGVNGDRLKRRRVRADYHDTVPSVSVEAQRAVQDARA